MVMVSNNNNMTSPSTTRPRWPAIFLAVAASLGVAIVLTTTGVPKRVSLLRATQNNPPSGQHQHMNYQFPYEIANSLPGASDPVHRGEFLEVFTREITTRYSEVYWQTQNPIPLPPEFVARFENSIVGFTGYEVDVQRKDSRGEYVSVPAYEQYNHHFAATITGGQSQMAYVGKSTYLNDRSVAPAHRHAPLWEAIPKTSTDKSSISNPEQSSRIPTAQIFVQGNGNEHRRSFKHLPKGYVQMMESPQFFHPNLMMINTNFYPNGKQRGGPLPRASKAPLGANYSGLIECPCTTRIHKVFTNHVPQSSGTCEKTVTSAEECFAAAQAMGMSDSKNVVVNKPGFPAGCFVLATLKGFEVYYNNHNNTNTPVPCGIHHPHPEEEEPFGHQQYDKYYSTTPPIRTLGEAQLEAANVSVVLDISNNVTISLSGPARGWFGVGFGAQQMGDFPYSIIVNGSGAAVEQKLSNHASGDELACSIHVASNVVRDGVRTIVVTRKLEGLSRDHYTFDPLQGSISLIAASGNSPTMSYHGKRHASASLVMVQVGTPTCICRGGTSGTIGGVPFTTGDCHKEPATSIAFENNPSCSLETYGGGLYCCRDGQFLLDADQQIPPQTDTYRLKYRFYYEDVAEQENAFFMFREVEFNHGEYDVPQCPKGTPPQYCIHTIEGHFQVKDTIKPCNNRADVWCAPSRNKFPEKIKLLHVSAHCHAPACISMELMNADTGQTICKTGPIFGTGDNPMDEADYVVGIPPCIWGSQAEGLMEPPILSLDTNLTAIKKANSTNYHYGVMSHFQMRSAWA